MVVALVSVGLLTGFIGGSSGVSLSESKLFWQSQPLGLSDVGADASGDTFFVVSNNTGEDITLLGYVANGVERNFTETTPLIARGGKKVIFIARQEACATGGNTCSLSNVSFKYRSASGLEKVSSGNDLVLEKQDNVSIAMFDGQPTALVCVNEGDVGECGSGSDTNAWTAGIINDSNIFQIDLNTTGSVSADGNVLGNYLIGNYLKASAGYICNDTNCYLISDLNISSSGSGSGLTNPITIDLNLYKATPTLILTSSDDNGNLATLSRSATSRALTLKNYVGTPADDLAGYTKLLLHLDGTNGGSTFTDELGHTVNISGTPTTSTTQIKFGATSAYFNSGSSYLNLGTNADWTFGADPYTVDFWIYPTDFSSEHAIIDFDSLGSAGTRNNGFLLVSAITTGKLRAFSSGAYSAATNGALTLNAWNHIAIVRSASANNIYINGVKDSSTLPNPNMSNGGLLINYGCDSYAGSVSYIDEFRVLKGYAVWTNSFSVPTSPYSVIASASEGTVLQYRDGTASGEKGIAYIGDALSRTVLQGQTIQAWTNSTQRFQLTSDGNFGIGTTTPSNKLNVVGDINATTNVFVGGYAKLSTTDSPATCSSSLTGALYFDTSLAKLCYCNGTSWCKVADDACTSSTSCG